MRTEPNKRPKLQLIEPTQKKVARVSSATCVNQHIKRAIHRVVFDSDLQPNTLLEVAWMFGITGPKPERKVLDILRETVREEMRRPIPPNGGGALGRAA